MLIALCVTGWMLVVILVCFCGSITADCRHFQTQNRKLHDRITAYGNNLQVPDVDVE